MAESRIGLKFGHPTFNCNICSSFTQRSSQLCLNHSQEPCEWAAVDLGVSMDRIWANIAFESWLVEFYSCPRFGHSPYAEWWNVVSAAVGVTQTQVLALGSSQGQTVNLCVSRVNILTHRNVFETLFYFWQCCTFYLHCYNGYISYRSSCRSSPNMHLHLVG